MQHLNFNQFKLVQTIKLLCMASLIALLTYTSSLKIKGHPFTWDPLEITVASYHLWNSGTISTDGVNPSHFREPLPIAITAAHMALMTNVPKHFPQNDFVSSEHAKLQVSQVNLTYPKTLLATKSYLQQISYVNLYYVAISLLAIWWLVSLLTTSYLASIVVVVSSWLFFYNNFTYLYRPITEFPASMFILLAAASAVSLYRRQSIFFAFCTGVFLAGATLTKAATLYVSIVAIPVLMMGMLYFKLIDFKKVLPLLMTLVAGYVIITAPWMLRNVYHFGELSISQRSGSVLLVRALKNQMSKDEYKGAFYAYAPTSFKEKIFEKILHFKPEDLKIKGAYAKLIRYQTGDSEAVALGKPEQATSYFAKMRAIETQMLNQMKHSNQPISALDSKVQALAMHLIKQNPQNHIVMIAPFAWRLVWSFGDANPKTPGNKNILIDAINFIAFLALLSLPMIAIMHKKPEWFAFSIFGVGLFWFYAIFSHAIPRYSAPLIPLALLSLILVIPLLRTCITIRNKP
ncbi:MAG: hypothetical protein CVU29_10205 [Betaproteobacteria bacterium HGW-Betaproteobacteria-22]|nr:MAG: hypothetical protein CVU29_10205 [Betaproteobacteria bacterium HGW-Betaproteobacteria-22]